jgi:hypothetical protein
MGMKAASLGGARGATPGRWAPVLLVVVIAFLGVLSGLVIPVGGLIPLAVLWALPLGVVVVFFPQTFYWLLLVLVLVVSGTVQYFTDRGQLQWVASGIGVCLLVTALLRAARGSSLALRLNAIDVSLLVFVATAAASTLVGDGGVGHFAAGLRNYLPFLGFYAYVRLGALTRSRLAATVWFLLLVAVVQWPLELYQALVVVPQRVSGGYFGSAWDSIVGTFGGPKFGGGASGSLAIYLVISLALALALWRNGCLSRFQGALCVLSILVGIGLAETKVVFVMIPVALFLLYVDQMRTHPVRFLIAMGGMLALLSVLLYIYFVFFWAEQNRGSVIDAIMRRFAYSFDPNFMPAYNWPGRMTGLAIWWRGQEFAGDPFHWLVGYGISASLSTSTIVGPGVVALKFGLGTDVTGATRLLWEVGVIGFIAYLLPLWLSFRTLGQVLDSGLDVTPVERSLYQALRASTAVLFLAVLYEVTIVSSPPLQLVAFLLYGVCGVLRAHLHTTSLARAQPRPAFA